MFKAIRRYLYRLWLFHKNYGKVYQTPAILTAASELVNYCYSGSGRTWAGTSNLLRGKHFLELVYHLRLALPGSRDKLVCLHGFNNWDDCPDCGH